MSLQASAVGWIAACVVTAPVYAGQTLYVDDDAPPGGDGSSWTTPFQFLQDALTAAEASGGVICEIRVGQGSYKPDQGAKQVPGDRIAMFTLLKDVALRGGFAGFGAPDPDERDMNLYVSTLSGDLAGNDGPGFEDNNENSYRVLIAEGVDGSAVLDGFTVTAGNANGSPHRNTINGGGMYIAAAAPTIECCTFLRNYARDDGGGVYCVGSAASFTNCVFEGNYVGNYNDSEGGGLYAIDCQLSMTGCAFTGNVAEHAAGGVCLTDDRSSFESCTFRRNAAIGPAHAVVNSSGAMKARRCEAVFVDCVFADNSADGGSMGGVGGAATFVGYSSLQFKRCEFQRNTATAAGGALFVQSSDALYTDCTFRDNWVPLRVHWFPYFGGAVYQNIESHSVMVGCILVGNSATSGGVVYNTRESATTMIGCTVTGNRALITGGAILSETWIRPGDVGRANVADSFFCDNTPNDFAGLWIDEGGNEFCGAHYEPE